MSLQGVQDDAARLHHGQDQRSQHLKTTGVYGKRRPRCGLQGIVGVSALGFHRRNTLLEPTFPWLSGVLTGSQVSRSILFADMPIHSILLEKYPPFDTVRIQFNQGVNVIAGPNGLGKSRLLNILQSHVNLPGILTYIDENNYINSAMLLEDSVNQVNKREPHPFIVRKFGRQGAIQLISQRYNSKKSSGIRPLREPVSSMNFQDWLVSGKYHSENSVDFPNVRRRAFDLALKSFSMLDESISFDRFDGNFRVHLNAPSGDVLLGQMSSGYQEAHGLIFQLIQELSTNRYPELDDISDFDGALFIDEIETHLHPSWQEKIIGILKHNFPKAQMFITTHSPHVIQGLEKNELIALERGANLLTRVKEIIPTPGILGFQGWTVEEILKDVMGLEDTISEERRRVERAFIHAANRDDAEGARPHYNRLMMMLHPENPLRRIYNLQFEALTGEEEVEVPFKNQAGRNDLSSIQGKDQI